MKGREFLEVAQQLAAEPTEAHWRTATVNSYYAVMLECRDVQVQWGFPVPARQNVHAAVRLRFTYSTDAELNEIGRTLDELVKLRNRATYHLSPHRDFSGPSRALRAIREAQDALTLLDQIETDPVRRAAAIASIKP